MVKHSGSTIIPERMFTRVIFTPRFLLYIILGCCLISFSFPQTTEEEEDPVEVFWGEDEEYDDEFYEDDTLGYEDYFDEEEYTEDDEYYDDEYYDDEYTEDDTSEYDEYGDEEYYEDDELSEEELADYAESKGFTLSITGASPGYVNHPLMTYNSKTDYRVSVEFPLLLQISVLKFRVGFEAGSYSFTNYMPAGGELNGQVYNGFLSFPAGPGQVRIGGGLAGDQFGFIVETTYGFALGNTLEIRAGVRSTSISNVLNSNSVDMGRVSWMDGMITLGISL